MDETTPRNQSSNSAGMVYITSHSAPACGRSRAIELTERVRPILNLLYTDWQNENEGSEHFEFQAERDACQRLISQIDSQAEIAAMLAGHDSAPRLRASEMHPHVWSAASAQWATGHLNDAVLAAVNSLLQTKVRRRDVSEARLVQESFSKDDPGRWTPKVTLSGHRR